jgi:polyhydroxybutyrate depolymerase
MKRLLVTMTVLVLMGKLALAAPPGTARPSAGCGQPSGTAPALVKVDGRLRQTLVVLPDDYRADRPHALIFGFHGRTNDNAQARRYFELETSSSRPAIHVYPAGLLDASGNFTWWRLGEPADALRDFTLFDMLLAATASGFCIDLDAVYLVGHSLGASFANSLACARADRIRGVVTVAGGINQAACTGEVAAMLIHNPRDEAVPLSEGQRARDALLGHAAQKDKARRRRIGAFTCDQYRGDPNPLFWCLHRQDVTQRGRDYPHQWPSGTGEAVAIFIDRLSDQPVATDERSG